MGIKVFSVENRRYYADETLIEPFNAFLSIIGNKQAMVLVAS